MCLTLNLKHGKKIIFVLNKLNIPHKWILAILIFVLHLFVNEYLTCNKRTAYFFFYLQSYTSFNNDNKNYLLLKFNCNAEVLLQVHVKRIILLTDKNEMY